MNVSGVTGDKSANEIDVTNFIRSKVYKITNFALDLDKSQKDALKIANTGVRSLLEVLL